MDTTISSNPFVTVLMPVYNGEAFLREAIESVLQQTYSHFELLIINDGSTDRTEDIIKSFTDARIHYVKNETNLQLIATLNKGIALSAGKYIVRMDADDISLQNRIESLVHFMETNPKVGVCGSFYKIMGKRTEPIEYPTSHDEITTSLLFYSPLCHPTTIWRTEVVKHNIPFDSDYKHAEDYKFWTDIVQVTQIANVPEVLLLYREHTNQVSNQHAELQANTSKKIRKELLATILPDITPEKADLWEEIITKTEGFSNPLAVVHFLNSLVTANAKRKSFNHAILLRKLRRSWKNALQETPSLSISMFCTSVMSPITKDYRWTVKEKIVLFLKMFKF